MLKVWWYPKPYPGNFGDILTPHILTFFGIKWEYSENYDTICVGSIAVKAMDNTMVLGSGIMKSKSKLNPNANWKFVRGPFTREAILKEGGDCPEIYGDPALLLPLIVPEGEKKYDVGIVPHYVDYDYVKEKYPDYRVINLVSDDPLKTALEISECRTIISSSLHGIICAHAYGIPAAWVNFTGGLYGDGIKFKDYYASVGLEAELSSIEEPLFTVGKIDINPIIKIFMELADESFHHYIVKD